MIIQVTLKTPWDDNIRYYPNETRCEFDEWINLFQDLTCEQYFETGGACISKENYRLAWFYASADAWIKCPFFWDTTQIYIYIYIKTSNTETGSFFNSPHLINSVPNQ